MLAGPKYRSLETLLLSLFDAAGLRRFLHNLDHGDRVLNDLPGESASRNEHVRAAIEALHRQGRIDASFFEQLCEAFEHRQREIRAVAAKWRPSDAPAQASKSPGSEWFSDRLGLGLAALLCVAVIGVLVLSLLGALKSAPPAGRSTLATSSPRQWIPAAVKNCFTGDGESCIARATEWMAREDSWVHRYAAELMLTAECSTTGRSCLSSAFRLRDGEGSRWDLARARLFFKAACDRADKDAKAGELFRENPLACSVLGDFHARGDGGVAVNAEEAARLQVKACELGSCWGCKGVGDAYMAENKPIEAEGYYEKACVGFAGCKENGDHGCVALGDAILQRSGDVVAARRSYQTACESLGSSEGCRRLAEIHWYGRHEPPSRDLAVRYLARPCDYAEYDEADLDSCVLAERIFAEGHLPRSGDTLTGLLRMCLEGKTGAARACQRFIRSAADAPGRAEDMRRAAGALVPAALQACEADAGSPDCDWLGALALATPSSRWPASVATSQRVAAMFERQCLAGHATRCERLEALALGVPDGSSFDLGPARRKRQELAANRGEPTSVKAEQARLRDERMIGCRTRRSDCVRANGAGDPRLTERALAAAFARSEQSCKRAADELPFSPTWDAKHRDCVRAAGYLETSDRVGPAELRRARELRAAACRGGIGCSALWWAVAERRISEADLPRGVPEMPALCLARGDLDVCGLMSQDPRLTAAQRASADELASPHCRYGDLRACSRPGAVKLQRHATSAAYWRATCLDGWSLGCAAAVRAGDDESAYREQLTALEARCVAGDDWECLVLTWIRDDTPATLAERKRLCVMGLLADEPEWACDMSYLSTAAG